MNRAQIDADWPILEFYLEPVIAELEAPNPRAPAPPHVSRRQLLEAFAQTKSKAATATALDCSPSLVNEVVYRAFRIARRLANVTPRAGDPGDH